MRRPEIPTCSTKLSGAACWASVSCLVLCCLSVIGGHVWTALAPYPWWIELLWRVLRLSQPWGLVGNPTRSLSSRIAQVVRSERETPDESGDGDWNISQLNKPAFFGRYYAMLCYAVSNRRQLGIRCSSPPIWRWQPCLSLNMCSESSCASRQDPKAETWVYVLLPPPDNGSCREGRRRRGRGRSGRRQRRHREQDRHPPAGNHGGAPRHPFPRRRSPHLLRPRGVK